MVAQLHGEELAALVRHHRYDLEHTCFYDFEAEVNADWKVASRYSYRCFAVRGVVEGCSSLDGAKLWEATTEGDVYLYLYSSNKPHMMDFTNTPVQSHCARIHTSNHAM